VTKTVLFSQDKSCFQITI